MVYYLYSVHTRTHTNKHTHSHTHTHTHTHKQTHTLTHAHTHTHTHRPELQCRWRICVCGHMDSRISWSDHTDGGKLPHCWCVCVERISSSPPSRLKTDRKSSACFLWGRRSVAGGPHNWGHLFTEHHRDPVLQERGFFLALILFIPPNRMCSVQIWNQVGWLV